MDTHGAMRSHERQIPDMTAQNEALSPEAEARRAAAHARREQRLAQALRENLKRRKAQIRGRTTPCSVDSDQNAGSENSSLKII